MPSYSYVAKDRDGNRVQGKLESATLADAESKLAASHEVVYRVEQDSSDKNVVRFLNALAPMQIEELVGMSQAIAAMADGGISLKRTMDILYEDTENPTLRRMLGDMSEDIGEGKKLAQALARHGTAFPRYYVAMAAAGESSGNLPEMMRRLAEIITALESLKSKAKAALSYPVLLFGFSLSCFFVFYAYGSSYLDRIYNSLNIVPPFMTRVTLGLGVTLANNKIALGILAIALLALVFRLKAHPNARRAADRIRLSLPIMGNVYRVLYTSRFLRTMSILFRSGLGLAPSVRLAAATVGNELVTEELFDLSVRLEKGEELSSVLRSSVHVSRLAVGMIAAGEESGKIDVMLAKVADVYELKSEALLQSARSRLEPLIMLVIGTAVAGLMVATGWPLLSILTNAA